VHDETWPRVKLEHAPPVAAIPKPASLPDTVPAAMSAPAASAARPAGFTFKPKHRDQTLEQMMQRASKAAAPKTEEVRFFAIH